MLVHPRRDNCVNERRIQLLVDFKIYKMFQELEFALKIFNFFFTGIFIVEAAMKVSALGLKRYLADR